MFLPGESQGQRSLAGYRPKGLEESDTAEPQDTRSFSWLPWAFAAMCGLSLVAASRGYALVAVHRLLVAGASLLAERGL